MKHSGSMRGVRQFHSMQIIIDLMSVFVHFSGYCFFKVYTIQITDFHSALNCSILHVIDIVISVMSLLTIVITSRTVWDKELQRKKETEPNNGFIFHNDARAHPLCNNFLAQKSTRIYDIYIIKSLYVFLPFQYWWLQGLNYTLQVPDGPYFVLNNDGKNMYYLQMDLKGRVLIKLVNLLDVSCRYVPKDPHGLESVLVGGDRLTEGNSRNIQWAFAEGESREHRLEGLVFKFEDWHAIRNLFEVGELTQCLTSNSYSQLAANYCTTSPENKVLTNLIYLCFIWKKNINLIYNNINLNYIFLLHDI